VADEHDISPMCSSSGPSKFQVIRCKTRTWVRWKRVKWQPWATFYNRWPCLCCCCICCLEQPAGGGAVIHITAAVPASAKVRAFQRSLGPRHSTWLYFSCNATLKLSGLYVT